MDNTPQILDQKSEENIKKQAENKRRAENMREGYRRKAFNLMIQLAVVIGVPAFLALCLGKKIDATKDTGNLYVLIFLGIAVIISWTFIIIKYRKFDKEVKQTDAKIKQMNIMHKS